MKGTDLLKVEETRNQEQVTTQAERTEERTEVQALHRHQV